MIIGNDAQHWLANISGHLNQDHLLNSMATGETSKKKHYSLYASIEVREKDLQKLREHTELTIVEETKGNVNIKWLEGPEVAIISGE